jgi:hypothetical protein
MGGRASKQKGNAGELELCKIMQGIFGGNWNRSCGSGAYIGRSNSFRKQTMNEAHIRTMTADIIPAEHMSKAVIESKSYADFPYHQLYMNDSVAVLDGWIEQAWGDATGDLFPILAFKINRKGWSVCVDAKHDWVLGNHVKYKDKIVAELKTFLQNNKEQIETLTK